MKKNLLPLICFALSILFMTSCEEETDIYVHPKVEWYKLLSSYRIRIASDYKAFESEDSYAYDKLGRETAYESDYGYGSSCRHNNYSYNGLTCTFNRLDRAYIGSHPLPTKVRRVYLDYNFIKLKEEILYHYDTGEELTRKEFGYDKQCRETEVRFYTYGIVHTRYTNYAYNGLECTFDIISYKDNVETTTHKVKRIYYDNSYVKLREESILSQIKKNDTSKIEISYDLQGREVGRRRTTNTPMGNYTSTYIEVYSNYQYNGKKCTRDIIGSSSNGETYYEEELEYY